MITSGTPRLALTTALVAAAALIVALDAHARPASCPADNRLAASVSATLGKSLPITSQQVSLLLQMFALESAKRPVPPAIVNRLRSRTAQNGSLLATGERKLKALPPGTPQGRAFKRLALRYLHDAVRPMNACIGRAVEAKTVAELGAAVTCFDNGKRKSAPLERAMNNSLTQLAKVRRCSI
jgi:hypothetical protein